MPLLDGNRDDERQEIVKRVSDGDVICPCRPL